MAGEPMMQPAMWANGVAQPNFSQPLMDFSQLGKIGDKLAGKPQQGQQQPQLGQPMQLQPGAGQGQPVQPGQLGGANNNMPFVQALMRMFGGGGAGGPSLGQIGGTNPFGGGSSNAIR